jgi:crotonobetainyl-CoA:carnitine CoA-transferase CaiB-like acyl-CoA transferase
VIKIERPGSGDGARQWGPPFVNGESAYYLSLNRNKKSLTLNLRHDRGRAVFWKLLEQADVLVENFRPGTMAALGLGADACRARNPRLVYCSISGHGQTGPRSGQPAYDLIVQGETGLMDVTGDPDGPPTRAGIPVADLAAALMAVQGILAALLRRAESGAGCALDIALTDSLLALLTYQGQIALSTSRQPGRTGNQHPTIAPYETVRTRDGWMNLAVGTDRFWRDLCRLIGAPELAEDGRFARNADRVRNRAALQEILCPILEQRTTAEWQAVLSAAGVPCGPVRTVAEALQDPARRERGMVVEMDHPTIGLLPTTGTPVKTPGLPTRQFTPPPRLGEHTGEILGKLGYSVEEIDHMKSFGIV